MSEASLYEVVDQAYLLSQMYPTWSDRSLNHCKVTAHTGVTVSVSLLDLRGRLINAHNVCAYSFYLNAGGQQGLYEACPSLHWPARANHHVFPAQPRQGVQLDIVFDKWHHSAEGKLWLIVQGDFNFKLYTLYR